MYIYIYPNGEKSKRRSGIHRRSRTPRQNRGRNNRFMETRVYSVSPEGSRRNRAPQEQRWGLGGHNSPFSSHKIKTRSALGLVYSEAFPNSEIPAYLVLFRPRFPSVQLLDARNFEQAFSFCCGNRLKCDFQADIRISVL